MELLHRVHTQGRKHVYPGVTIRLIRTAELDAVRERLEKHGTFPDGYPEAPLAQTAKPQAAAAPARRRRHR
jgi:hypothetical protein